MTAYAEDHSALRWPLLLSGLGIPLLSAAFVALSVITRVWAFAVVVAVAAPLLWGGTYGVLLMYVWPTGIRLDDSGVRIGGVRWADRHPGRRRRRRPVAPGQRYWVFSCPWDGVRAITVITDPAVLKELHRRSWGGRRAGLRTLLGVLGAPYMRAALVIKVDLRQATFPHFSDKRGLLYGFVPAPGSIQRREPWPYWAVPTRRPDQLWAALQASPEARPKLTSGADTLGQFGDLSAA
jgi:hypothetical protein